MLKKTMLCAALAVALAPANARAQGASLHGFGPINSSMAGAGVALPEDSLNALGFNPALVTAVQGNQISFSTEFFKDGIEIHTTVGSLQGDAHPNTQLSVAPAFGWMAHDPSKKLALGFGVIGVSGFGTDYPQDNGSLFFATPPNGFGRIFTGYQVTKVPVAFGYQVTPKLAVGASLNIYIGQFSVAPLPYNQFDVSANGDRWYPEAGKPSQAYSAAGQFGIYYQVNPMISIGASYTMKQNYTTYKWNSSIADPSSTQYGAAKTVSYSLDGPMTASWGVALKPNKKTDIAIDGMFTRFTGVDGFGSPGGVVNRIVQPFGWKDVWTIKTGVRRQVNDKMEMRVGYNYSQMPLRPEVTLSATGAPATFQHHFTGGLGMKIFPFLSAEIAGYFVPRQHIVGPFLDLDNVSHGTVDESNVLRSVLIGLNFHF